VPSTLPLARRFADDHLGAWGLPSLSRPVLLGLNELVTNAIVHGAGAVDVTLRHDPGAVTVVVGDDGTGTPALRPPGPPEAAVGGWGLQFVDQLADAWGTERSTTGGTVVWFAVATDRPGLS
jgi:two-component sensor histidine kinase